MQGTAGGRRLPAVSARTRIGAAAALITAALLCLWPLAASAARGAEVTGFVVFWDSGQSRRDFAAHLALWSDPSYDAATITPQGGVQVAVPKSGRELQLSRHLKIFLCVSNYGTSDFDPRELRRILQSAALTRRLAANIVAAAQRGGYAGINIDFEENPAADAGRLARLLSTLRAELHKAGRRLTVDVPAKTPGDTWDGGYDLGAIGRAVDGVIVMAYDDHGPGGPPGPIAPAPWVRRTLAYTLQRIPRSKVFLGVPAYAYDWHGRQTDTLTLPQVQRLIARLKIAPRWNGVAQTPYFRYRDASGQLHTIYYEDARSLAAQLALARRYGVAGVSVWYVGSETPAMRAELAAYAKGGQRSPVRAPAHLWLRRSRRSARGRSCPFRSCRARSVRSVRAGSRPGVRSPSAASAGRGSGGSP